MILQQLRIFLQILCVPVILSQSYHGFECHESGRSYDCYNMKLADVASNFDTWNKVHKMLTFIIGIFSIEYCQLIVSNFENFNYFYYVFTFIFPSQNGNVPISKPIRLVLTATKFDDNLLTFRKFNMKNSIVDLTLSGGTSYDFIDYISIDVQPFDNINGIFIDLRSLNIENIPIEFIEYNTFDGLDNLEIIFLKKTKLKQFICDLFKYTPNLDGIYIDDGFEWDEKFQLSFKSSGIMKELGCISIINTNSKIDLSAYFDQSTFSGLTKIRHLILQNNSIESIPQYTFHNILNTLEKIDLSQNRLKALPMHIFEYNILAKKSYDLEIDFRNNPWPYKCNIQKILFHEDGKSIDIKCLNSNNQIFSLDKFCNAQNFFDMKVEDKEKNEEVYVPGITYDSEIFEEAEQIVNDTDVNSDRIISENETPEKNEPENQETNNKINDKTPITSDLKHSNSFNNEKPERQQTHLGSVMLDHGLKFEAPSRSNTELPVQSPNLLPVKTSTNSPPVKTSTNSASIQNVDHDQNPTQDQIPATDLPPNQHYTFNGDIKANSHANVDGFFINHSKFICQLLNETKIELMITNRTKDFQIKQISFGDWLLSIDNFPIKSALIGLERSDENKAITCVTNIENETKTFFKQRLASNRAYRYCWMQLNSKTISPLNCMALIPPRKPKVINIDAWILTTHITSIASGFALTAFLAFLFGIAVAVMLAKAFPRKFRGKTIESKPVRNGRFKIGSMPSIHQNDHRRYVCFKFLDS